ncbi:MAG TPA: TraB/GumN family protein [Steroidobacteraceae bacterium]
MRRWICLLFSLFGCLSAHAEGPVWAIRGAQNTVYLAGSIHLLKAGDATLPAAFDRAYEDAEALVMEIDLDDLDPFEAQKWMMERGTFEGNVTLRDVVGEESYRRVSEESRQLGLAVDGLQRFEPWTVALTLVQLKYMQLGFDSEQGVEKQLERRARADGKEITGLETVEEQLGYLDGLSYENQARFLDLTISEMKDIEHGTGELLAAWRAGDTEKLSELLTLEYRKFPALYNLLLTERNKRWMPQIEKLLKEDEDYMIVVGALHLVGDDGLLAMLESKGLKAQQVQ